jgi:hypothetical protein
MLHESGYGLKPIVVSLDKEEARNAVVGQDVFFLTGFPCERFLLEQGVFPVFYRKGTLSFCKKFGDPQQPDMLIIDGLVFKGASGSPVFVKETHTDIQTGQQRQEARIIGVVTNALTSVNKQNTGFTGIMPIDSLIAWLKERDAAR